MGDTADGSWSSRELGGYIRREQGRHEMNPEYEPMKQAEIEELSREAGRELTEREAYEYLKRRTHRQAVGTMLEPKRDITLKDIERADKAWRKHSHGYSGGFTYRMEPKPMNEPKRDITLEDIDRAERAWRLKQVLHADEAYQREMEDRANQDSDVDGETEETK